MPAIARHRFGEDTAACRQKCACTGARRLVAVVQLGRRAPRGRTAASSIGRYAQDRTARLRHRHVRHLDLSLAQFRFWYNAVRPPQHLGGRTPVQVWQGNNPNRQQPTRALWFEGRKGRLLGWVLRH